MQLQPAHASATDAAIFGRLIKPDHGDFSPAAAREILSVQFDESDKERMHQLSLKAQDGTLNAVEQAEIESGSSGIPGCYQEPDQRPQQRLAPPPDVVHELEEPQVQRQPFL
jgi:hypothetical protein